jgi:hypothetical protein
MDAQFMIAAKFDHRRNQILLRRNQILPLPLIHQGQKGR